MKVMNNLQTLETNANNFVDAFSEEFNGKSFYGLEYILDDVFPAKNVEPLRANASIQADAVDWFGLYQ